jgi:Peptide methionine sulfoxide reductase
MSIFSRRDKHHLPTAADALPGRPARRFAVQRRRHAVPVGDLHLQRRAARAAAEESRARYQSVLTAAGYGEITTEIVDAQTFSYAEDYHQQYLAKNPAGCCGMGGTGLSCPIGLARAD